MGIMGGMGCALTLLQLRKEMTTPKIQIYTMKKQMVLARPPIKIKN